MNCKVCLRKFESSDSLHKHLNNNKKCFVLTNKNKDDCKRVDVIKPILINIKVTQQEYNVLLKYKKYRTTPMPTPRISPRDDPLIQPTIPE
jgi:hypothetical protein